jgi:cytochrome c oxidase subunit II
MLTALARCPVLLAPLLCLAGCNETQTMHLPHGEQALAIDMIWRAMLWVCGTFYVAVLLGLAVALLRRRRGAPSLDTLEHSERKLHTALWAWVGLIGAGLIGLTAASYTVDRRLALGKESALNIRVTAKQWWWQVQYLHEDPSMDFTTANEIVLPAGREALVALEARDVIHSLWVPNLAGKRDMIPGRHNQMRITALQPGEYRGQCAEFCGLQHAFMALDVHVRSEADFERWQVAQREPARAPGSVLAQRGMQVFLNKPCITCHAIAGTDAGSRMGPDLTHFASRTSLAAGRLSMNLDHVRNWIRDPQHYKPGSNMPRVDLSESELDAVAAYLMDLQ